MIAFGSTARAALSVLGLIFLLNPAVTGAATYTVTTSAAGGPGSLLEALISANSNLGLDTIEFAIPGPGPHVIPSNFLVTDDVVIDGYTQPGAAPNTNGPTLPFNGSVRIVLDGEITATNVLVVAGASATLRGLCFVNAVAEPVLMTSGGPFVVQGCLVNVYPDGAFPSVVAFVDGLRIESDGALLGGTDPADRNVLDGDTTIAGNDNVVRGNFFGLSTDGTSQRDGFIPGRSVLEITGDDNLLGGAVFGARNIIGASARLEGARNAVRRNYIGTDASGTVSRRGSLEERGQDNVIGGRFNGGGNVFGGALSIRGSRAIVRRNDIGIGAGGVALPVVDAVTVFAGDVQIGGPLDGDGNRILNYSRAGVVVRDGNGVTIRRNEIGPIVDFSSVCDSIPAIDLGGDGHTPNDFGDVDSGPNDLLNHPEILDVVPTASGFIVQGRFEGIAGSTYVLEIYSSPACDASGYGPGHDLLRVMDAVVPVDGSYEFALSMSTSELPVGRGLSMTLTDPNGSTSEFSRCLEALTTNVVNANDSGYGSLRRALEESNARAGRDTVIVRGRATASGANVLDLTTPLPVLVDPVHVEFEDPASVCGVPAASIQISGAQLGPFTSGLVVQGAGSRIVGADVRDFLSGPGLWILGSDVAVFTKQVRDCAIGVLVEGDGSAVTDVRANDESIRDCTVGVSVVADSVSVASMTLERNEVGVKIEGDGATLTNVDVFESTGNGVEVRGQLCTLRGSIPGSSRIGIPTLGNGGHGILVDGGSLALYGFSVDSDGTTSMSVAGNALDGIEVLSGALDIGENVIVYENVGLGIDLGADGPTPNDAGDGDAGPNGLLNHPVLTRVETLSPSCPARVSGFYEGLADTNVTVTVYGVGSCDPSGFGEGQAYLGRFDIVTDSSGQATFDDVCLDRLPPSVVSASAIAHVGASASEFGPCLESVATSVEPTDVIDPAGPSFSIFPNPSPGSTTIAFDVREGPTSLRLSIFDLRGRRLRTMETGDLGAGRHTVIWDGRDDNDRTVAGGVYLVKLEAPGTSETRRVTLLR